MKKNNVKSVETSGIKRFSYLNRKFDFFLSSSYIKFMIFCQKHFTEHSLEPSNTRNCDWYLLPL